MPGLDLSTWFSFDKSTSCAVYDPKHFLSLITKFSSVTMRSWSFPDKYNKIFKKYLVLGDDAILA